MELDRDLQSQQEARTLAKQAETAQRQLNLLSQQQLDTIVEAVAAAFYREAPRLAKLAVEETGFGNEQDKTTKNRFASRDVAAAVKDMKTVGIVKEYPDGKLMDIGVPVGVIAAIVPSTNPTSTVCYKAIIALKAGNSILFSPHPKAIRCTLEAARVVMEAARQAGAPEGSVGCLSIASMAGCKELMTAPQVRLILATGGPAMVKSAYSSGKPAIGVGAGNGPAYIHPSADMKQALRCILRSKSFDYGTVCASEQSILIERSAEQLLYRHARELGFWLMEEDQAKKLSALLFRADGRLNPDIVGKSAEKLAGLAGFSVPQGTKVLVAREQHAGPGYPYSMEKLCPVLALYVLEDEEAVLHKAIEILSHEGHGHTFSIHAREDGVIRRFAQQMPVSRFLVNTPAALGGIGATTALFPALTLGCGAVGGSSSSNNISPMDLINIRRVAWGIEENPGQQEHPDDDLVEVLTRKIMERLGT